MKIIQNTLYVNKMYTNKIIDVFRLDVCRCITLFFEVKILTIKFFIVLAQNIFDSSVVRDSITEMFLNATRSLDLYFFSLFFNKVTYYAKDISFK